MSLKLIFSTFIVIFLAELGDKTQLAAMAASAGSNKPFSVLIGASVALILSSALAVAVGSFIGDHIPLKYIKIAAGIVFIVFGGLYLKDAFVPEKEAVKPRAATFQFIGDSVIKAAQAFEEQELNMLRTVRQAIGRSDCLSVIDDLIVEDEKHLESLSRIKQADRTLKKEDQEQLDHLNEEYACSEDDMQVLRDLYNREAAMADFYRLMSDKTKIAGVKAGLYSLYLEELEHCAKLRPFLADNGGLT